MSSDNEKNWRKQFQAFLSSEPVVPPAEISRTLFAKVREDLNPRLEVLFGKLALAHLVAGLLVVSVCPQLGVGPLWGAVGHLGLMSVFMTFGSVACTILCGAFFLSVSQLLSTLVLKREELRRARSIFPVSLSLLVAGSLLALSVANGNFITSELLLWAFGAMVGGFLSFQLGLKVRGGVSVG